MALPASVHKGIVARKLTEVGINADLDPLWEQQRPLWATDAECAVRVFLSAVAIERGEVIRRMKAEPPTIDSAMAYPLLAAYRDAEASANAEITALQKAAETTAEAARPATQVGYINLGFSTNRGDF